MQLRGLHVLKLECGKLQLPDGALVHLAVANWPEPVAGRSVESVATLGFNAYSPERK